MSRCLVVTWLLCAWVLWEHTEFLGTGTPTTSRARLGLSVKCSTLEGSANGNLKYMSLSR